MTIRHRLVNVYRRTLPPRGEYDTSFYVQVDRLLHHLEDIYNISLDRSESVNRRLAILETHMGIPNNGTFFQRLTYCLDQVYGTVEGDWFCIRGIVITTELEALQHLEMALGINNTATNNLCRLSNIEGRLNLPITTDNYINRLQRAICSLFLNNNNNANPNDNDNNQDQDDNDDDDENDENDNDDNEDDDGTENNYDNESSNNENNESGEDESDNDEINFPVEEVEFGDVNF